MTQQEAQFLFLVMALFSAFFGACVGSFLNVCIYRIPRDESVITPRSHCPHCQSMIPWYLNIPVLSWLLLRGRCARCKGPISFRYTLVELLTALLFLAATIKVIAPQALHMQPLPHPHLAIAPILWVFVSGLILGTFVDFEHFIIPDSVTIGGMVVGPVFSALVPALHGREVWWQGLSSSAIGLAAGFGLLYAVGWLGEKAFKKEAMGFGDVKLMGAIGAFLGWQSVLFTLFAASLLGSLISLTLIAFRHANLQSRLPFGPYLSAGALVWIFWGQAMLEAYTRMLHQGARP